MVTAPRYRYIHYPWRWGKSGSRQRNCSTSSLTPKGSKSTEPAALGNPKLSFRSVQCLVPNFRETQMDSNQHRQSASTFRRSRSFFKRYWSVCQYFLHPTFPFEVALDRELLPYSFGSCSISTPSTEQHTIEAAESFDASSTPCCSSKRIIFDRSTPLGILGHGVA